MAARPTKGLDVLPRERRISSVDVIEPVGRGMRDDHVWLRNGWQEPWAMGGLWQQAMCAVA